MASDIKSPSVGWYDNDAIFGHLFLTPSIYVREGYQRMFSKIEVSGCDAFIEVIYRIVNFLILPIVAALSAVFTPIGLIVKGLGTLCYNPPIDIPKKVETPDFSRTRSKTDAPKPTQEPVKPLARRVKSEPSTPPSSEGSPTPRGKETPAKPSSSPSSPSSSPPPSPSTASTHTSSSGSSSPTTTPKIDKEAPPLSDPLQAEPKRKPSKEVSPLPSPPPAEPKKVLSTVSPKELAAGQEVLSQAEKILNGISSRKIDLAALKSAHELLKSQAISAVLATAPEKFAADDDPIKLFSEKYLILENRYESLKFLYDFHSKTLSEEGELSVADDGNCLFTSFLQHGSLADSETAIDAQKERDRTVDWIEANYKTDSELQIHLLNSLCENFTEKLNQLEIEQQGLLGMPSDIGPSEKHKAEARLKSLPAEMEAITMKIISLSEAMGNAFDGYEFSKAESFVSDYLKEMRKDKTYGGAAELYALSCIHRVCVKIYRKNNDKIDSSPYTVLNEKLIDQPPRHFTHTKNHYNPYFPKDDHVPRKVPGEKAADISS